MSVQSIHAGGATAGASSPTEEGLIPGGPKPVIMGAGPLEKVTKISGYAPLRVQLRAIYTLHDVGDLKKCVAMNATLPILPKDSPQSKIMKNCLNELMELARKKNAAITGNSDSVTWARFEWDLGVSPIERLVPNSKKTYQMEKQEGFAVGYVYDKPGKYLVKLRVTNSGANEPGMPRVGDAQPVEIEVLPRPVSATKIYVSSVAGSDTNSGSSESNPVKTAARAQSLITDNSELFFKRGEVFPVMASLKIVADGVHITSYGNQNEAKPVLVWSGSQSATQMIEVSSPQVDTYMNKTQNTVIEHLTLDTDINGIFGKTNYFEKTGVPNGILSATRGLAVRDITFLNINAGVMNNARGQDILVTGCSAPLSQGLRAYFVWNEGINVHLIGNQVANSTREHIARSTNGHLLTVHSNNDFDNKDLRESGDPGDISKSNSNVQFGFHFFLRNNSYAGGPVSVGPLVGADGRGGHLVSLGVIENNELFAGSEIQTMIGTSDVMIRNNIVHVTASRAITVPAFDEDYQQGVSDIVIAHNTIDIKSVRGACFEINGSDRLILQNNLCVNDQLDVGGYGAGMIRSTAKDGNFFRLVAGNYFAVPKLFHSSPFKQGGDVNAFSNYNLNTIADWTKWQQTAHFIPLDQFFDSYAGQFTNAERFAPTKRQDFVVGPPAHGVVADFYGNVRSDKTIAGAIDP